MNEILSPEQVRMRQMKCFNEGLCFVSLKLISKDTVAKALFLSDGYLSMPVFVLPEYIK